MSRRVFGVSASNVNVLVAFGGGIISFLSPCVLPIVPGYLSLVTGLTVGELEAPDARRLTRIAVNTGLFVLGFTLVFVALFLTDLVGERRRVPQPGDAHARARARSCC